MSNIGITLTADNRAMIQALQQADRVMAGMSRDMTGALRQVEAQARSTGQAMASMGGAGVSRGLRESVRDMNNLGMSAKATSAALRNVPAQFTDIVVSLQGGQAPLTVLLQQGGQLKDMFGGIGPAARALGGYVMGMVNPFTLAAGAAAVLGLAYKQGSEEADAFRRALLLSGNAAGTTVDQLNGMAAAMDQAFGVTTGKAADALTAMAGTGRVARASLQDFAQVAIDMEKSFGQSIEDTAKNFAELGKDPLGASKRLNESLNFLTAATYAQIRAAVDLGETEKAAAIAQDAYAKSMSSRASVVTDNLGYIERAYRASVGWAKEAWDAILGVGRKESSTEKMAEVRKELDLIDKGLRNVSPRQKAALEQQLAALQEVEKMAKLSGDRQAERAAAEKANIIATDQAAEKAKKNKEAREAAAKKAAEDAKKIIEDGVKLQQGLIAQDGGLSPEFAKQWESLSKAYQANRINLDQLVEAQKNLLDQQPFVKQAAKEKEEAAKREAKNLADSAKLQEASIRQFEQSARDQQKRVDSMQEESAAIALMNRENVSLAVAVEMVNIAKLKERQIDAMGNEQAVLMIQKEIDQRQKLIDMTKNKEALDKSSSTFGAMDIGQDATNAFGPQIAGALQFADALKMVSDVQAQSAEAYRANLAQNGEDLEEFGRRQQEIALGSAHAQVGAYAAMAGGLKSYTKQGSKEYQALHKIEKAMYLMQIAMSAKAAFVQLAADTKKIASSTAVTGVKSTEAVANTAASVPFPFNVAAIAIIVALLARSGAKSKGGGGGGAASTGPINTGYGVANKGQGTNLGFSDDASQSIVNAINQLKTVQDVSLTYSRNMIEVLKDIDQGIGKLAVAYIRTPSGIVQGGRVRLGGVPGFPAIHGAEIYGEKVNQGIVGFAQSFASIVANGFQGLSYDLLKPMAVLRGNAVYDTGLGELFEGGMAREHIANVNEIYESERVAVNRGLAYEVQQAFALVYRDIGRGVTEAASFLGLEMNGIYNSLNSYVSNIGNIDLTGMSGKDIEETFTAIFSAEADRISKQVIPQFVSLQKAGEGYFETLSRVANQMEVVQMWTRRTGDALGAVGVSAAFFADDLIKRFGGLSDYQTAISKFYDDFFTAEEKIANQTNELTIAFTRLGISVPESMSAFKDLALAQDLSTASGRYFYSELLKIAPAFSDVAKAAETAFKQIGDALTNEINRIRGVLVSTDARGLPYLQSEFAILTAQARAGDQEAAKRLPEISRAMIELSSASAATMADLQRVQGLTAASLAETRAILAARFGFAVPAFADGGLHGGGLRLVGENGPELEVTGPSRIFNAQQTAAMMGSGGTTAGEIRAMREELVLLRAEARAIATHTHKTAKILDRVTPDGNSLQTKEATA